MKLIIILVLFQLSGISAIAQQSKMSQFQNELRRVERLSDRSVNLNFGEICKNDSSFLVGWLILSKEGDRKTKAIFISNDVELNRTFEFYERYEINVNWTLIEPKQDTAFIIKKFIVGCPASGDKYLLDQSQIEDMLEQKVPQLWRGKVIALKPSLEKWQYPRY